MPLLSYYYFISKSINRSLNRHSSASAPNTGRAASSLDAAVASDSRRQSGPRSPCTCSALCCSWIAEIATDGGLVTMPRLRFDGETRSFQSGPRVLLRLALESVSVEVKLNPGYTMHFQSHTRITVVWNIFVKKIRFKILIFIFIYFIFHAGSWL